ncbi:hypothetical protein ACSVH5_02315 [Flavobacterium sp. RSSA_27]|uniref:hypothetical protein n=1 Tax=Flavobacterium sp. RSSA_27 TaxID=3447667 RepID=UPI003F3EE9C3
MKFITSQMDYKRESLFRGISIKNSAKLNFDKYYTIIHEMVYQYEIAINNIIH